MDVEKEIAELKAAFESQKNALGMLQAVNGQTNDWAETQRKKLAEAEAALSKATEGLNRTTTEWETKLKKDLRWHIYGAVGGAALAVIAGIGGGLLVIGKSWVEYEALPKLVNDAFKQRDDEVQKLSKRIENADGNLTAIQTNLGKAEDSAKAAKAALERAQGAADSAAQTVATATKEANAAAQKVSNDLDARIHDFERTTKAELDKAIADSGAQLLTMASMKAALDAGPIPAAKDIWPLRKPHELRERVPAEFEQAVPASLRADDTGKPREGWLFFGLGLDAKQAAQNITSADPKAGVPNMNQIRKGQRYSTVDALFLRVPRKPNEAPGGIPVAIVPAGTLFEVLDDAKSFGTPYLKGLIASTPPSVFEYWIRVRVPVK